MKTFTWPMFEDKLYLMVTEHADGSITMSILSVA
jgi:hypothetical protein